MSFYCKENPGQKLDITVIDGEVVVTIESQRQLLELVAVLDEDQSAEFVQKVESLKERI